MPRFMDHHPMPDLPPGAMEAMAERIKKGESDDSGVTPINVFAGKEGHAFCLSDGPDKDAIVDADAALGVTITAADVHEVQSLV